MPFLTRPSGKYVLVYDGLCRFCTAAAHHFLRWFAELPVELLDFQQSGALDRFPGVSREACLRAMQLVTPDGRVFSGVEAIVQALAARHFPGRLAYFYYLPGIKQLLDVLYVFIAANRYRIAGKTASGPCEGTCALHGPRL